MCILEETIQRFNRAQTTQEAFDIFLGAMQYYGYDKLSYTLCTDHPSLSLPKQHGLSTSYPDDWMAHYNKKNYLKVDPVVKELLHSRKPFFWDDVINKQKRSDESYRLMREAEDAGVGDGIGISIATTYGEITGIGIARSQRLNERKSYDILSQIYLLSTYFHETYRGLITRKEKITLTPKEIEILSWAVEGKMDDDIADLMNISFNTVRFHWKNIFTKLSTFNKVHAVSKALRLKLVMPGLVTY